MFRNVRAPSLFNTWPRRLIIIQYLQALIRKVEKVCEESGLRNDSIVMRMIECSNGFARPYLAVGIRYA